MVALLCSTVAAATPPHASAEAARAPSATIAGARAALCDGQYSQAADGARAVANAAPDDLGAWELLTSALLFQVRSSVGSARDRNAALSGCTACHALIADFLAATQRGRTLARTRLQANEEDLTTLFLLARIDLNYVWLHHDLLGKKKGWSEYWEARRSLDRVFDLDPEHVRAGTARAWIDYIVGTRVPRGTRWLLGGGDRKRAIASMRTLAESGEGFDRAEAMFALWEIERREGNTERAIAVAERLAHDFPDNREISSFLASHRYPPPIPVREQISVAEGY
jgi:tetratricopeptide (TPR) repeat protein